MRMHFFLLRMRAGVTITFNPHGWKNVQNVHVKQNSTSCGCLKCICWYLPLVILVYKHGMNALCALRSHLQITWPQFSQIEHTGSRHALQAIYLSKNDHSFSVDIMQLPSIRYFHVSKKRVQIWLQFIEGPLVKTEPDRVLHLQTQIRQMENWFACKRETVQECIPHPAELTLMKLYWNVPAETGVLQEHSASQGAWKEGCVSSCLGARRGS